MNTDQINKALKNENCFIGTFALDKIPSVKQRPAGFVVNCCPSHLPGKHWIAIYINKNNIGIYFDSFGLPPINKDLYNYMNNNSEKWVINNKLLQNANANTCGKYCILFIKLICSGTSLTQIQSLFTTITKVNEALLEKYLRKPFCKFHLRMC